MCQLRVIRGVDVMSNVAYCHCHQRLCPYPRATLHIAGPPCVDWSSMGLGKGKDGPTYKHFAAWCGMRKSVREPCILMENVTRPNVIYSFIQTHTRA